ncbi:hypothetical protein [Sandarakinorhabdus sp.]|uniref:hypothetical protein n=1 Tax=Sandarakinorhabdus sp. TaxID=1916663 RepID=UPI00286E8354|nr:hypothetical protein [Sandarakinorhabdus sp.]
MITRLQQLGRVLAFISLLFGGAFVVLARRSAATGENGEVASVLFWVAAVLQFALVFVLLWRRLPRGGRRG